MSEQTKPQPDDGSSGCSIAPDVPYIPSEAAEFAREVSALCDKYGIRSLNMEIEIDKGLRTKYWGDHKLSADTLTKMQVQVSKRDGRGRPRTQVQIIADVQVRVPLVWEPNTSN